MVIRVGINGFGRIGRITFRKCLEDSNFEIGAINDPALDSDYICYLIKYDSTHGKLKDCVTCISQSSISVNGIPIKVYREKQPSSIPWEDANVKYVIESSGMFTSLGKASGHLHSDCVKGVIVTAPSVDVPMIIKGVNEHIFNADTKIISCASSTLYCLAPIVKILEDNFGVKEGLVTSIHAMTPSLRPLDGLCIRGKHWRDHRSIHQNIIPAVTSACKALEKILPQVEDKFCGIAFRVPIVNVSVLDITVRLAKNTTLKEIADSVDRTSRQTMKNIIKICKNKVVSSDFIGDTYSCTLDVDSSIQLKQDFFKLICWYENEYSYACRIVDLIFHFERVFQYTETMFKTKNYDDISKTEMHSEHLKHCNDPYRTSILSTTCESTYKDTSQYHINASEELTKQSVKGIGLSSILEGKNMNPREWLTLKKHTSHHINKPVANHHRNPFTQCCLKETLERIYKFNDETLADGETVSVKINNFQELLTICKSNDLKTLLIPPVQELLNNDSLKTVNVHSQEINKQDSVDDFKTGLNKIVSDVSARSTCVSDIKTNNSVDEESEIHIKLQKDNPQDMTLRPVQFKDQPKGIKNKKGNKIYKSEDFKTHAVKTINKVIDEFSQTMAEYLFSFNKKSNKNNERYAQNEQEYEKYLQTGNIITEKEKIIINNNNKNTKELIKELQDKFANNKHQYLICNTNKSRTKKKKHEHSNQSCNDQNTITKEFKVNNTSTTGDNMFREWDNSLKLQRKPSEICNCFVQNQMRSSSSKIKINRKMRQLSDKKLNRCSSTILIKDNEVNESDVDKREYSAASTNLHSNFESTKNDYACFFEDVDSRTTSDMFQPEKFKMEIIHLNRFHETVKKDDESDSIVMEFKNDNHKPASGDFNCYTDKDDLYDKLDSTSGTDSSNSFQVNEKKSQIIQLSDLTNSLDDIARLQKICQIIEISDELSDKLFSSLKEDEGRSSGKKWSFKDLCQKLKLDEFCNSVFENISN